MDFADFRRDLELQRPPAVGPENVGILEEVGSTNALARAVVADYDRECTDLPHALLLAFAQSGGRGRLGRAWSSPRGKGVYATMTMPVAEAESLLTLPLLVGVGLCRVLDGLLPEPCRLKWPNDLMVGGRKIGGILIETLLKPEECSMAVIGFGVNHGQSAAELPERATSLRLAGGAEVTLARLTWDLVAGVERELIHVGDAAYAVASYRQYSLHQPGDSLSVRVGEEVVEGRFAGLDERGMLLLETAGGEVRVSAGEVIAQ
ncbi:MAG TPA: biotin--[acetyl-CoA-carboxylase] ligase [Thermoanaerobaculia bacterium]|nr:biotin--[acetyl-CoA-carboxylase] ligase [Thermoanaerobaculia bacterium]